MLFISWLAAARGLQTVHVVEVAAASVRSQASLQSHEVRGIVVAPPLVVVSAVV